MVSNTSKKCLLALVLVSSLAPISLHCADGSKNSRSFWSKYGLDIATCVGITVGGYIGAKAALSDINRTQQLHKTQAQLNRIEEKSAQAIAENAELKKAMSELAKK